MQSIITSKFQTTIPKAVRENLKISVKDALEWKIVRGKVIVFPAQNNFLNYQNTIKTGKGDIADDIKRARNLRAEKYRWKHILSIQTHWYPFVFSIEQYERQDMDWPIWHDVLKRLSPELVMWLLSIRLRKESSW